MQLAALGYSNARSRLALMTQSLLCADGQGAAAKMCEWAAVHLPACGSIAKRRQVLHS